MSLSTCSGIAAPSAQKTKQIQASQQANCGPTFLDRKCMVIVWSRALSCHVSLYIQGGRKLLSPNFGDTFCHFFANNAKICYLQQFKVRLLAFEWHWFYENRMTNNILKVSSNRISQKIFARILVFLCSFIDTWFFIQF